MRVGPSLPLGHNPQLGSLKKKAEEAANFRRGYQGLGSARRPTARKQNAADCPNRSSGGVAAVPAPIRPRPTKAVRPGNEVISRPYPFLRRGRRLRAAASFVAGQMDVVRQGAPRGTNQSVRPGGRDALQRHEIDVIAPPRNLGCESLLERRFEPDSGAESAEIHWHPDGVVIIGGESVSGADVWGSWRTSAPWTAPTFKMYVNERRVRPG